MRTGYKEQPKNAWKNKGLALPTVFAIDEFFRHNEDTKWVVEELERCELAGLFGFFLKVTSSDIQQALDCEDSCPLEEGPYQDLHGDLSPEAIVNDMCKGHFGSDCQSTYRVLLPPKMWLIDSIFHFNGFPIDMDEIVVNEPVGMYGIRGLRQDIIAYRTQSQQDFLEFRSQYQQDMLDLWSLLQAILDAQQRPPRV
ncbi:hypothetical protein LOK49_LG08G01333 [Camellia lanceoleosa]|uniref:Uncharacterized protein n=1 Tax=Camellia lanceoleosa TaxID=1840588 RepID=A0ACC0GX60_9ERIC|nr:hypothetical protein LOK49_LG08G01333 [Camellia lanceoleosa]